MAWFQTVKLGTTTTDDDYYDVNDVDNIIHIQNKSCASFAIGILRHMASVQRFHNNFQLRAGIKHQVFPLLNQKYFGPKFVSCEKDMCFSAQSIFSMSTKH